MLRRMTLVAALMAGCAGIASAAALDDIQAAVQKLASSDSYSWTSTVEGGFGAGTTEGKTQKDGATTLSITRQDNTYEVVIAGGKAAIKADNGWESAAEAASADNGGGGFNPERFLARMAQTFKTPATVAQDIVGKLQNVQKTDDGYSADLPADLVKTLLAPPRRRNADDNAAPEISNASGSIKIWIKDGTLTKVQHNVKGTVSFNGNDRDIDRTTTIEFKDVGSTTVTIPDEAKAKLEAPPATQP